MNKSSIQSLELDVEVAVMVVGKYGYLTPAVQDGLGEWFADVSANIVLPMKEMPLDDSERSALMTHVLEDMLSAVRSIREKALDDVASFRILAPVLEPLWLEICGILAPKLNKAWQNIRPKDSDDLEQRVAFLENALGVSRHELRTQSLADTKLEAFLSKMGLRPDDLI